MSAVRPPPLDERQTAMLHAMGITQWQAQNFEENTAPEPVNSAQEAPEIVAKFLPPTPPAPAVTTVSVPLPLSLSRPVGVETMDWLQLQDAVRGCQACALCENRKNAVFGTGQAALQAHLVPRVDLLVVGEVPNEDEDAQGQPFTGPAGILLDNMLRSVQVNGAPLGIKTNVFLAHALKCRPANHRNPSAEELATCQPYMLRQIALLQPKIILVMGRFAVQSLLGSVQPMGKLRGQIHHLDGVLSHIPVIVSYHPAYLINHLEDKAKAWQDLLLVMQTLESTIPTPELNPFAPL